MSGLRYADLVRKPTDVLDMTSLTPEEFELLVPALETAFQAHMAEWRLDGKQRTARRYTTYRNCPLPTPTAFGARDRCYFDCSCGAPRRQLKRRTLGGGEHFR